MRSASGEERLYDLTSDPEERLNAVASQRAAVAALRDRLDVRGPLQPWLTHLPALGVRSTSASGS
jgi:hypothetical protein